MADYGWNSSASSHRHAGPIWYPVRLLGTVAGAMLVSVTMLILNRSRRPIAPSASPVGGLDASLATVADRHERLRAGTGPVLRKPHPGATGLPLPCSGRNGVGSAGPFMKLAHVIYRPVALFFYALKPRLTPADAGQTTVRQ